MKYSFSITLKNRVFITGIIILIAINDWFPNF